MCRISETSDLDQSFVILTIRSVHLFSFEYSKNVSLPLFSRKQLMIIRKDMQIAKDLVFTLYQKLETILINSNVSNSNREDSSLFLK